MYSFLLTLPCVLFHLCQLDQHEKNHSLPFCYLGKRHHCYSFLMIIKKAFAINSHSRLMLRQMRLALLCMMQQRFAVKLCFLFSSRGLMGGRAGRKYPCVNTRLRLYLHPFMPDLWKRKLGRSIPGQRLRFIYENKQTNKKQRPAYNAVLEVESWGVLCLRSLCCSESNIIYKLSELDWPLSFISRGQIHVHICTVSCTVDFFCIKFARSLQSMFHMTDLYVTTANPSLGPWITSFAFALVWTPQMVEPVSQPVGQPVSQSVSW